MQSTMEEILPRDVIEDDVHLKEDTQGQGLIQGQTEGYGLLDDSGNLKLVEAIQGEEPVHNESECEEFPEDETQLPASSQR